MRAFLNYLGSTPNKDEVRGDPESPEIVNNLAAAVITIPFSASEASRCSDRCYFAGLGRRNGEQHGLPEGWNSINSTRIPSGSYRLNCHLPSRPICA